MTSSGFLMIPALNLSAGCRFWAGVFVSMETGSELSMRVGVDPGTNQ